ncbi:sirohydrochlorin chelatase [Agromyces seonyuensis]|uniref:Cobalamin biosynthesis protein CbiX n=1 Tax=Agromyces seonyuensis TaxID=2662446 RepID=A0A6I4NZN8_9MICO|nr:CbiX/SirB N-terminal domain-containing protein [Agromyces seonyuensis]MWB99786.1 cobalamin biosynthesis protein CbiX [Agromyces seonyuensis]
MSAPTLLAVSHGTADPAGQAAIARLVAAVADRLPGVDVRLAHVDVQAPDVDDSLALIPSDEPVVLVPLLLSAGYHVRVDLADSTRGRPNVRTTPALGPDERLVDVLVDRLDEAGLRAGDEVVLIAAGSSDAAAVADCRRTADELSLRLGRPVTASFLSAAEPRADDAIAATRSTRGGAGAARSGRPRAGRVVAASYLLAPGYFQSLAEGAGADITTAALAEADRTHPALVDVVVGLYLEGVATHALATRVTDRALVTQSVEV